MQEFNIFTKLQENLKDFEENTVVVANTKNSENARYLNSKRSGYLFSQTDMVNRIDLAMNSVYESGKFDSEGQRKVYLNIVRFIRDVSRMRTDIDTKNYVFNPDSFDQFWPVWLAGRQFKVWVRKNNYAAEINRFGDDFCTYGWAVSKRVGKKSQRVPIKNLFNTQDDAEGLDHAARNGGYAGEFHKEMTLASMRDYKEWDTEGLAHDKKYDVYEQYSLVPRWVVSKYNDRPFDKKKDAEMVLAQQILIPNAGNDKAKKGDETGTVLFIEEIKDDKPIYDEARWEIVDGRTMPRGPVENQLENQIARNMTANMRRRSLLWSSKKIFQSASEEVAKNLVRDVKDGAVLYVGPNGTISQVAMEGRATAEYTSDEQVWEKNSQQTSFTFEVATGESMPSGTPFRLGVILNNAVESFFRLKRQEFGLFLKRCYFNELIPIFKKETKDHTLSIPMGSEGAEHIKQAMIAYHTNTTIYDDIINGRDVNTDEIKQHVEQKIQSSPYMFVDVPEGFYDDLELIMELDITDEATDTAEQVQTLTTVWQGMQQSGDPRADRVLATILSKTGKNLESIAGPKPQQTPQQPAQGLPAKPQLNAIGA